jgi:integrase
MQWAHLNFTSNTWTKPTTKSGTSHVMPLLPALIERLQRLPRLGDFVFNCPNRERHWSVGYASLQWSRIRKRGNLPEVTIHDLRRTFASYLAMAGANASVIAKTLNHSSLQHTGIYARLDASSIHTALDKQAEGILGLPAQPATPLAMSAPAIIEPLVAPIPVPIHGEEWPG